ncbi:MAG: bifunctional adenosylcobinamide kinase/adenosylcobinamide-phosphate guanylyltransferase [Hyphomicrobiaceae bacterium]
MKRQTTLVLGGAKSGKTAHAMRLAERRSQRVYIATAEAHDDEMRARIHRHRLERDATWSTVEAPIDIGRALCAIDSVDTAVVVDCATLWLSNLLLSKHDAAAAIDAILPIIKGAAADIVLVSNEVGLGIVPENNLARTFRDAHGQMNQTLAAVADRVDFVAAGLAITLKSEVAD